MSLKVFDLQCELGHVFEGWFASLDNYESQQAQGLLSCPICNSHHVSKKLSAPRINVGHAKERPSGAQASSPSAVAGQAVAAPASGQLAQMQAEMMRQIRQIVRNADNVGAQFAQEARRMHEGEAQERAIRGTATPEEREALAEEGIAVMPVPEFLDDERLQ